MGRKVFFVAQRENQSKRSGVIKTWVKGRSCMYILTANTDNYI